MFKVLRTIITLILFIPSIPFIYFWTSIGGSIFILFPIDITFNYIRYHLHHNVNDIDDCKFTLGILFTIIKTPFTFWKNYLIHNKFSVEEIKSPPKKYTFIFKDYIKIVKENNRLIKIYGKGR